MAQLGIGRGMIIHHVDDALHTPGVDGIHQVAKILHGAIGRVDAAVVAVGIGTAEAALLPLHADGMDGHEPEDVRAQAADAVQIGLKGAEGALGRMVAHIDGIDQCIAQGKGRIFCHKSFLLS